MGQEQLVMMTWNAPPFSDDTLVKMYPGYILKHETTGELYSALGEMPKIFDRKAWATNCKAQRNLHGYVVLPCAAMIVIAPDTTQVFTVNGNSK